MKSIWTIVATLAVANLLGLFGFVGWLKMSDRLDGARVEQIRAILRETVTAQKAREAQTKQESDAAAVVQAKLESDGATPRSAAQQIRATDELDAAARQRVERLRREVEDLQRTLARGRAELEAGWAKLEADRKEFEEMRARIAALEGSEQFEKALKLYESLKPLQAKDMLQQLMDRGETEQVVAYLNAMQTRTASKILAEFKEPTVAADLLERLRTRGLEARGRTQPAGASSAPDTRTPDARRDAKPPAAGTVPGG